MRPCVVIYSGGLDSTVLISHLKDKGYEVHALTFNYKQRHKKEIFQAQRIAEEMEFEQKYVDISIVGTLLKSALTRDDIEVPDKDYSPETQAITVVPNRNAIMLSIAVGYAQSIGADDIFYASHKSDQATYPDCRPEFMEAFAKAMRLSVDNPQLNLESPFIDMTKTEIVKLGDHLGAPLEMTWSCYKGKEIHCGICGTCRERKKAFFESGVPDPTEYEVKER